MTQINVINAALLKLGAPRINNLNDTQTEAVIANEFYERSYRALLSMYPWDFAQKTVDLALDPVAPEFDFTVAYRLPSDFIILGRTFPLQARHKILGNTLHCNTKTGLGIKYTYRVDESLVSDMFEQTFMYYLASQMCISITENSTKEQYNFEQFKYHLAMAKSLNSQQNTQDGFADFPVYASRF